MVIQSPEKSIIVPKERNIISKLLRNQGIDFRLPILNECNPR